MDLIIKMLCDILFDVGTTAGTSHRLPKPLRICLLYTSVRRLLGEKGRVYIPIPANESGEGKVTIAAGERFIELSAVTDEQEAIPTGTQGRIIDVRGDVVAVEKDK